MVGSAIVGGVLLAMIEGVGILFNRFAADQYKPSEYRMVHLNMFSTNCRSIWHAVSPQMEEAAQYAKDMGTNGGFGARQPQYT